MLQSKGRPINRLLKTTFRKEGKRWATGIPDEENNTAPRSQRWFPGQRHHLSSFLADKCGIGEWRQKGRNFRQWGDYSQRHRDQVAQQRRTLDFISNPAVHEHQEGLQCIQGNLKNLMTLKRITEVRRQTSVSHCDHLELVRKKGILVAFSINMIELSDRKKDLCQPTASKWVLHCGTDGVTRELPHLEIWKQPMTAYNILSGQKAEGGVEAVPMLCCNLWRPTPNSVF